MKKLKLIIFTGLLLLITSNVSAGDASISSSATTVTVGSTVKITVTTKNLWGTYSVSSSNQGVLAGGEQGDIATNSFSNTYYFTAKSVGTATITFGPNATNMLADPDTSEFFNKTRSVTINVVKKTTTPSVDVNKVYSKNNNLSKLEIEGYTLTPLFNKDTLEYEVELEPGTEKININTSLESNKARVKGDGEVSVTEGINTINIVVTAENGNEKTYKILAKVDEKDPINIKIDKKKYTVVKKRELLTDKDGYEENTVKINKFDIPSLYNPVTKVTLVGVKDSDGKVILVSYDSKTGKYEYYNEYKFDLMNLYIYEKENSKYEKTTLKINGIETIGYKLDGVKDYYLVYATNTITGYEGYYLYDSKENSVQRYDTTILDNVTNTKDKYFSMVLVLSSVCFLAMLFLLIQVNRVNKAEKMNN